MPNTVVTYPRPTHKLSVGFSAMRDGLMRSFCPCSCSLLCDAPAARHVHPLGRGGSDLRVARHLYGQHHGGAKSSSAAGRHFCHTDSDDRAVCWLVNALACFVVSGAVFCPLFPPLFFSELCLRCRVAVGHRLLENGAAGEVGREIRHFREKIGPASATARLV